MPNFAAPSASAWQIGKTQIIVQAPVEHLLTAETHVGADLSLQLRECEIAVGIGHILSDGAAGIFLQACKNINHIFSNLSLVLRSSVSDAQKYK